MKCRQCGANIEDRAAFCNVCGEKQYMSTDSNTNESTKREASPEQNNKKIRIFGIIAASLVVIALAFLGNRFLNLSAGSPVISQANSSGDSGGELSKIRPEYRELGLSYLDKYTSSTLKEEAMSIGSEAWEERAVEIQIELKNYTLDAQNDLENLWSNAIGKLSVYALANYYEYVSVAESGGRSDEDANQKLLDRIENVPILKNDLERSNSKNDIQSVIDACDAG